MNDIVIRGGNDTDLLAPQAEAVSVLSSVKMVGSDADSRAASVAISKGKSYLKLVKDERMKITRQLDDAKKMMMARESDLTDPVRKELDRVTAMQSAYVNAQAKAQAEARAAAEAKAAFTGESDPAVSETAKPVAGVTSRNYWGIRIVNPDLVPRAYCKPDETLIREYMNTAKKNGADIKTLHIDGVEFYQEFRV